MPPLIERLLNKIRERSSGCWEWTAYRKPDGYGRFNFNGRMCLAHRAAWLLLKGPIPDKLLVLHSCDNRRCVNPDHLFLGTQKDNMDDMLRKDRGVFVRGERIGTAKLTAEAVREIRTSPKTGGQLAREYGLSKTAVNNVRAGKTWTHV